MKSFYTSILTFTLLGLGCGGGGGDEIPLGEFAGELAQAACEKEFDCCPQDSAAQYASVEDCVTELQIFTSLFTAAVQESRSAGRVSYDGARARECIDIMRGADCTEFQADVAPAGCEEFVVPQVAAGGACEQDMECTTGYCATSGADQLGTCETLPALGEACDFECAEGSYCNFGTSVCEALKADGVECGFDDECQSSFCDDSTGVGVCGGEPACM